VAVGVNVAVCVAVADGVTVPAESFDTDLGVTASVA
jgi:hypothetical protein